MILIRSISIIFLLVFLGVLRAQDPNEPPYIYELYDSLNANCYSDLEAARSYVPRIATFAADHRLWKYVVHPYVLEARCLAGHQQFQESFEQLALADSLLECYRDSLGADYLRVKGEWLISKAYGHQVLGDVYQALDAYNAAIDNLQLRREKGGLEPEMLDFLHGLYLNAGALYAQLGAYEHALQYYQYILRQPNPPKVGLIYKLIGDIHLKRAEVGLAEKHYLRAFDINKRIIEDPSVEKLAFQDIARRRYINVCLSLTAFYQGLSKPDLDKSAYYLQLATTFQAGFKAGTINRIYALKASQFELKGQLDSSLAVYKELLSIQQATYGIGSMHALKTMRAIAKVNSQQPQGKQAAWDTYQQALTVLGASVDPTQASDFMPIKSDERRALLFILSGKADLLRTWGQDSLPAAWETVSWALTLIDSLKWDYVFGEDKLVLVEDCYRLYEIGLEILYQAQESQWYEEAAGDAFTIMERSKSLLLLESLKKAEALHAGIIPEHLTESERSLKLNITLLQKKIEDAQNRDVKDPRMTTWNHELFLLQKQYAGVLDSIQVFSRQYFELRYGRRQLNEMKDVQRSLGSNQLLAEFFMGKDALFSLKITQDAIEIIRQDWTPVLTQTVLSFKELVSHEPPNPQENPIAWQANYEQYITQASQLYDVLVAPWLSGASQTNLILIPDGMLAYVPFEALISAQPSSSKISFQRSHMPYLINDYQITYAYSALTLQAQQASNRNKEDLALFAGFAPGYGDEALLATRVRTLRDVPQDQLASLGFLQYNAEEVRRIGALFHGPEKALMVDSAATEANFKRLAGNARILHFAMHSFLNDSTPMFSGLVFQPTAGAQGEDGVLFAYELMGMELQSEMAVLSMCGSESGQYQPGQGLMSLARAFAFAKCPSLVGSQWSVPDYSTSEIMVAFYEALGEGLAKDAALRQAKLAYLDQDYLYENLYHPNNWAPFIHIGHAKPISVFSWWYRVGRYVVLGGAAVSLCLFVGLWIYIRFRAPQASQPVDPFREA